MENNFLAVHRLPNVTRLLTVLLLTAVGVALLVPLTARSIARPPAAPLGGGGAAAHSTIGSSASPPPAPTTTVPTTTAPSTVPVAPPTTTPTPAPAPPVAAVVPNGYGCGPALAYLQAHAAPGFTFQCPGYAQGHQAMSCDNVAGVCPGAMVIAIATPCPAAYMNEASNSWVLEGKSNAAIDPYGYCQ